MNSKMTFNFILIRFNYLETNIYETFFNFNIFKNYNYIYI